MVSINNCLLFLQISIPSLYSVVSIQAQLVLSQPSPLTEQLETIAKWKKHVV